MSDGFGLRILTLALVFVAGGFTYAGNQCSSLFHANFSTEKDHFQSQRLQQTSFTPGRFGGVVMHIEQRQYVQKKIFGKNIEKTYDWFDYGTTADQAGDMRVAFLYLPEPLKKHFSITALKSDLSEATKVQPNEIKTLTIPNFTEMTAATLAIQNKAKRTDLNFKIFHFYEASEIVNGMTYIQKIAEQAAFPLSTTGALFEHDFNYHFLSSLVTPSYVVSAVQKRAQIILLFHDYIARNAKRYDSLKDLKNDYEKKVFKNATQRFDLMANIFVHLVVNEKENSRQVMFKEMGEDLQRIFLAQKSPVAYLKTLIELSLLGPRFGSQKFSSDFQNLFSDFETYLANDYQNNDLSESLLTEPQRIYADTVAQMNQVNQAAIRLNDQSKE